MITNRSRPWVHKLDLPCKTSVLPLRLTSPLYGTDHAEKLRGRSWRPHVTPARSAPLTSVLQTGAPEQKRLQIGSPELILKTANGRAVRRFNPACLPVWGTFDLPDARGVRKLVMCSGCPIC